MSANDTQVGGQHYKTSLEHWDFVLANDIPYLEAQVIKYLTRWRKKNGMEDVLKAKHYLDKLIEVENAKSAPATSGRIHEASPARSTRKASRAKPKGTRTKGKANSRRSVRNDTRSRLKHKPTSSRF